MNQFPQPCTKCTHIQHHRMGGSSADPTQIININGVLFAYSIGMQLYVKKCCLYTYYTGGRHTPVCTYILDALISKMKKPILKYAVVGTNMEEVYELKEKKEDTIVVYGDRVKLVRNILFNDYSNTLDAPYEIITYKEGEKRKRRQLKEMEKETKRTTTTSSTENGDTCQLQYVYLIRERTAVVSNQPIYKIGKTTQKNFDRFKGYGKGYEVYLHIACNDCHTTETAIIEQFTNKYRRVTEYGSEYFEGNRKEMIQDICNIVFA